MTQARLDSFTHLYFINFDILLPPIDAPTTERVPKRTLRSSRSTDAKPSETPVVDDATQPPPNSSPGELQQQRVRTLK